MERKELIAITFCMAISTLVGCSSPEVSAITTNTDNAPTITQTVERTEPTPTEVYVDSLISESKPETATPTITVERTTINTPDVQANAKTVSTTKVKTVAEKSGIKKVNATKYTNASVNVRADATKDSKKLGTLSINKKVIVTGKVNNGWYRIKYKDGVGYIKATYLSNKKTEVKTSNSNSGNSSNSSSDSKNSGSSKDNGSSSGTVSGDFATDDSEDKTAEELLNDMGWDDDALEGDPDITLNQ